MISVAMATYNGENYIIKQLESIRKQSIDVDEVIICDDQSTDNTVKVINEYIEMNGLENKWKVIVNECSLGFINNFFKAIMLTSGDYIFLSDQDDIFYEKKFQKMIDVFRHYPECVLVNANYEIIDENDNVSKSYRTSARKKRDVGVHKIDFKRWLYESSFPGFSMGFKACIRERIKSANIENCYGHDQLIGLLALDLDGNYVLSEVLSGYRIHNDNTTGGKKIIDNYSLSNRVKQKEKEKTEYIKLKNMITDNEIKNVEYDFIKKREQELDKRISYMKSKNIFGLTGMLFVSKAYPKGTILGDCIYILKGQK